MDVDGLRLFLRDQMDEGSLPVQTEDTNEFYDRMIETAAIAAAACESVLRQRGINGKTFYEPK